MQVVPYLWLLLSEQVRQVRDVVWQVAQGHWQIWQLVPFQ